MERKNALTPAVITALLDAVDRLDAPLVVKPAEVTRFAPPVFRAARVPVVNRRFVFKG